MLPDCVEHDTERPRGMVKISPPVPVAGATTATSFASTTLPPNPFEMDFSEAANACLSLFEGELFTSPPSNFDDSIAFQDTPSTVTPVQSPPEDVQVRDRTVDMTESLLQGTLAIYEQLERPAGASFVHTFVSVGL